MASHVLKIWPEFFDDIASGAKQFEFRRDDRPYMLGDRLHLQEYRNKVGEYTGRTVDADITYVLRATKSMQHIGMPVGYCILGIKLIDPAVVAYEGLDES